ncbi:PDR/VanB family oxidoreductase [Bordetella sp. FB-8]|uniref:PDR/VanB family oxidoreductase n=1 Tax=Bordetella sp. FB-8 TaxID=1159870 RepID=UPI0003739638|nr:PDR/VanB family oxidoreductase [Bordetella sp. FB-8]
MHTLKLIVREVRQESPLIRSFRLESADGGVLPAYSPGAHIKVQVPGLHDPRNYSLINTGSEPFGAPAQYRLGVRLEENSQGGSRYMHALKVGEVITAQGPANEFPLADHPGSTVLIAGGIGITPIASMAASLASKGSHYTLHYSGRSRSQLAFVDALRALAGDRLVIHADDDPDSAFHLDALLDAAPAGEHVYVCGPKGLIDAVIAGAKARDWDSRRVHFELFTAAVPQAGDGAFEVDLKQSGKVFTIPADKTILEVLEEAGCDPMYDCKRGECGVCQATVLEGTPDHRDYYLSEAEKAKGNVIQICVSRAKSGRLVLDL